MNKSLINNNRLIISPMILSFMALLLLSVIGIISGRVLILKQMKQDNISLTEQIIMQIENNYTSLSIIENSQIEHILSANRLIRYLESAGVIITDYLLDNISELTVNDMITVYSSEGEVLAATKNSPRLRPAIGETLYRFLSNNEEILIEEVRADILTGDNYLFGALKSFSGNIIQSGISAEKLTLLTEMFNFQSLVTKLASKENIDFAYIVNKNYISIADSDIVNIAIPYNKEFFPELGHSFLGEINASIKYSDRVETRVLKITAPVKFNDSINYVLVLGISLDKLNAHFYIISFIFSLITIIFLAVMFAMQKHNVINPVKEFDAGIRKIDIERDTRYRIILDDYNPFNGLVRNFNHILDKVELYIKEIHQSEETYKEIFNAIHDALFVVDINSLRVTDANTRSFDLFESTKDELYNRNVLNLYLETHDFNNEHFKMMFRTAFNMGQSSFECIAVKKSSKQFYAENNIRKVNISGKECFLLSVSDISLRIEAENEKKKLSQQLSQSQKMDAIGQLAGGIAHDFNNMLGGIIGSAQILKLKNMIDFEGEKYLDLIIKASNRAGELTKQLLTFSRKSHIDFVSVDISNVISDTVNLLRRTIDKAIAITIFDAANNHYVNGDSTMLQNAFMNIAINASHAMPEGGTIEFVIKNKILDSHYCDAVEFDIKPGEFLEISIRDSGYGMSQEILLRIFEPFFTTKEQGKGTGLGLAATYGTIQEHHGAISVYSEVGKGTVFHIYLPVSSEQVCSDQSKNSIICGNGTVLVIDDEEIIRIVAKSQLEALGYTVICAENGRIGLEKFEQNTESVNLIILDMIMPVMGGKETLKRIREINKIVPVLISSGFSKDTDIEFLKQSGANDFISKPFTFEEISDKICKILNADK